MRKNIDFSKLKPRQIAFFAGGLTLAVIGLVFSVITFATELYSNQESFPFDLTANGKQLICADCPIGEGQSLWLGLPNRQIEYTDIGIDAFVGTGVAPEEPTSSSSFTVIGLRNQYDGMVFYRLQSLEAFSGQEVAVSVAKTGADTLDLPASIVIRTYQGIEVNPYYLALMIVGVALIVLAFRLPSWAGG